GTDIVARLIGQKLTESYGQQIIVDNRAGATGTLAANLVSKAVPDGYTLIMGHAASHTMAPAVFRKLGYDGLNDFSMISYVGGVPHVLVVSAALPAKNVKELLALARAKPKTTSFASSGIASGQHLAGEMFKAMNKLDITHVPYKGSAQANVDLMGGQVTMNFDTMPSIAAHVQSGKLRALGVTVRNRVPQMPDVPTLVESGMPNFEIMSWYGVMGPAGTPKAVVAKLNADVNRIMRIPEIKAKLEDLGTQMEQMTPAQFTTLVRNDLKKYSDLVRDAHIVVEQ
ncbi:MAG TPA: tripartite tricarboxylate transporter substrate binding protein, partial [Burkholderiales bacterium]|nr:tripartite tricarboxylate transporter substrate binding protein [Burkholderiales bacterium]